MQQRSTQLIVVLLSLVLAGCASSGNASIAEATGASVAAQLVKGRTTQADVEVLYIGVVGMRI